MGVDYDSVGGIGIEVTNDLIQKFISQGIFLKMTGKMIMINVSVKSELYIVLVEMNTVVILLIIFGGWR